MWHGTVTLGQVLEKGVPNQRCAKGNQRTAALGDKGAFRYEVRSKGKGSVM